MNITERGKYIFGGVIFGLVSGINGTASNPWKGEWAFDNFFEIVAAMIGGGLLGIFIFGDYPLDTRIGFW